MAEDLHPQDDGFGPITAYLAEKLKADNVTAPIEAVLTMAGKSEDPVRLRRRFKIKTRNLVGLSLMVGHARAGAPQTALRHAAMAVPNRADGVVLKFIRKLEKLAPEPGRPFRDADGSPIVFVVSYPRSGNTRFLNIMDATYPRSRLTAFLSEGRYFSARSETCALPSPVFVKDHNLRAIYGDNPVIYLARDGRDCVLSGNDFALRAAHVSDDKRVEGSDSLSLVVEGDEKGPPFGGWPQQMQAALAWKAAGRDITILNYDDWVSDNGYELVSAALRQAGVALSQEQYDQGLSHAQTKETALRVKNDRWKRARIYTQGSMMDQWLDTPDASKWRKVLTPREKQRLHEAGFTKMLIEGGFETDPDWWR
ncbi:MAG: hypothetical protein AAGJ94_11870 [Pseudomonadota bacterium]